MVPAFNSSFLIFRPSLTFLDTAVWEDQPWSAHLSRRRFIRCPVSGIWQDHLQSMTPLLPWSSKPSLEPCFQWWSSSCLPSVTRLQKFCHPSSDHPPWIPIELGRTEKLNKVVLRMVKFPHLPNLARSFWLFRAAEVCCAAPASCSTKQRSQRLTHTHRHSHKGSVLRVQNAISSVALFRLPWRCWLAKDHVKVCKRWNSFLFLILHVSQRWFLWEMSSLKKYVRPGWRSWRIEGSGMWTWGGQGETDSKERGKGRKECQDNGASFQGNGRHSKFLKVSP